MFKNNFQVTTIGKIVHQDKNRIHSKIQIILINNLRLKKTLQNVIKCFGQCSFLLKLHLAIHNHRCISNRHKKPNCLVGMHIYGTF